MTETPNPSQSHKPVQQDNTAQPNTFRTELQDLINRHSRENASGTPDFILATFLDQQLALLDQTITDRANWRGESVQLSVGAS